MAKKSKKNAQSQSSSPTASGFVARMTEAKAFWLKNWIAALILFATGFGLYVQTVNYEYVLDDQIVVTDNVFTNKGFAGIRDILLGESFVGYFQKREDLVAGSRYRPLSIVTFAIERQFFEAPKNDGYGNIEKDANGKVKVTGDPAVSHGINALLYALSGLLLFRVLCMLFPPKDESPAWYLSIPFAATLVFLVHPIHVEVVANIKGRDEIMTMFFCFSTLYYGLRYVRDNSMSTLIVMAIHLFLALLSKENALTFVVLVPMTLYYFTKADKAQLIRVSIPLLISTFAYLALRYQIIGYFFSGKVITDIMNNPFYGMTAAEKWATITYTLGLYLKLCFYPHPLTHDYYPYAVPVMSFSDIRTILSLVAYIGMVAIGILGFKKRTVLSYSIWLYLIALSMVSNIAVPIGSFMNERFAYISSIGFCIALCWFLLEKLPSLSVSSARQIRLAGAGIITLGVLALGWKTVDRVPAFRDHFSLDDADIEVSKNSCRANCFMGVALYQRYLKETDSTKKRQLIYDSETYLRKSLEIYPDYFAAMQMLSGVLAHKLKYDGDIHKLLDGFYSILERTDKVDYIDKYFAYMNALGTNRDVLPGYYHHVSYDLYYKKKNDKEKARRYAQLGLSIDPNNQQLLNDMKEYGGIVKF